MKKLFFFSVIVTLLFSCGSKNRELKGYMSSFLNENKKISVFGRADLKTILDKAAYKEIPVFGVTIEENLKQVEKCFNVETPAYFAVEIPKMDPKATEIEQPSFYAFFSIKNADSTAALAMKMGQDVDKDGDLHYFQSHDVNVGFKGNLGVLYVKSEVKDAKKALNEIFEKTEDDEAEGVLDEILSAKGDILLGTSYSALYNPENPLLEKLSKEKKNELEEMVKDSYSQSTFHFNNGEIVIESKNYFSDALKERMFLKEDSDAKILSKLGGGKPKLGFAMNLDMKKLQAFMEEFSPGIVKSMGDNLGGPAQMALLMGGDGGFASLFSGEIGLVMVGEPNKDKSMLPEFNFYVGFGPKGKTIGDMAASFLSSGTMKLDVSKDGMKGSTNPIYAEGKLEIPKGFENFGKSGITAFANFEDVDINSFELGEEWNALKMIKYITLEANNETGKMVIKLKNNNENVLKQTVQFVLKELQGKISMMSI